MICDDALNQHEPKAMTFLIKVKRFSQNKRIDIKKVNLLFLNENYLPDQPLARYGAERMRGKVRTH